MWSCPSESTPLGLSADKKFAYSHYAGNNYLGGLFGNDSYPFRKVSSLLEPARCLTLIDNGWIKQDRVSYTVTGNIAFRHGGGSSVSFSGDYKDYTDGKRINAAFYDGHAQTMPREDFMKNGNLVKDILLEGF